ncbi:MAG TPA: hypothetical protein VD790_08705 [Thermoleophilaceae bacterium]|nr:hypothetical protein [Thermoleophilaceae bacterium]
MLSRFLPLFVLLLMAAPSGALAQSGGDLREPLAPQTPVPVPPEPAPEPQPVDTDTGEDDGLGGTAFWLIIGTTGAIFFVVAFLIVRDMRKTVGRPKKKRRLRGTGRPAQAAADALAGRGDGRHEPGSHKARAKAQQRAKTKAARKQRRQSRSR